MYRQHSPLLTPRTNVTPAPEQPFTKLKTFLTGLHAHPSCFQLLLQLSIASPVLQSMHRAVATHPEATEDVDYKTNASLKPPYSYAELICMVRHNLSFNKCFVKVPREKDEPGKGGFWKLDPQHAERLKKDAFRKRRVSLGLERRAWDKLPSFAAPCSRRAAGLARMGIAHPPCTPTSSSTSRSMHRAVATHPEATEDVDYKTNASLKPPYSYAELICMAMEASNQPKIPPSAIYKWITDNFCYFRHANATWQNSVRHNLSFNKCFVKVPREKDEPGKGGFWKLDPQHAERLKKDAFRKRRVSLQIHPALTRRVRQAAQGVAGPAAVVCTVESMLSVDKESQKLLEEFEAMTGEHQWSPAGGKAGQKRKLPSPKRMAKASRLSNLALATEEQALPAEEKALRTEEAGSRIQRL
ncbi:forkhead box protein J1-like [Rhynochetos jubatus]